MTVFLIDHRVKRFSAVMNACAGLGLAWDKETGLYLTADPEQAAALRKLGAKVDAHLDPVEPLTPDAPVSCPEHAPMYVPACDVCRRR